MIVAVMQPYLFPYVGYFQLIHAVDDFVIYDDVNYINAGWINRNYILGKNAPQLMTMQLNGASQNLLINEISVGDKRHKLLKTIQQTYSKAPFYKTVFPLIESVFSQKENNLAKLLTYSLKLVCDYLDLHPNWHISSELKKDNALRGQQKILAICDALGATQYINNIGGQELYEKQLFSDRGVQLSFIESQTNPYPQYGQQFMPNLSIIDVLMFNDVEKCQALLEGYKIV